MDLWVAPTARIGLVLLDLTMPGMKGDEVLQQIRRLDPEVRVLLCSGYHQSDAMSRIPSEKIRCFVPKPYDPAELLHRVRQALSSDEGQPGLGSGALGAATNRRPSLEFALESGR